MGELYEACLENSHEPKGEKDLKSQPDSNPRKIAVVIGPEGGLADDEVDAITNSNKNSKIASLGSSILRAQTACILACGLVKYENEKMLNKGER